MEVAEQRSSLASVGELAGCLNWIPALDQLGADEILILHRRTNIQINENV